MSNMKLSGMDDKGSKSHKEAFDIIHGKFKTYGALPLCYYMYYSCGICVYNNLNK